MVAAAAAAVVLVAVALVAFNPVSPSSFEGIEEQQPMTLNFIQARKREREKRKGIKTVCV